MIKTGSWRRSLIAWAIGWKKFPAWVRKENLLPSGVKIPGDIYI